jgi:RNA recognition motif-containing protein
MVTRPNPDQSPDIDPAGAAVEVSNAHEVAAGTLPAPAPAAGAMQRVYVGNLAAVSDEAAVRALFATYGAVSTYERPVDHVSKAPTAFAYVEMASADALAAIAALDGHELDDHALRVSEARKPRG